MCRPTHNSGKANKESCTPNTSWARNTTNRSLVAAKVKRPIGNSKRHSPRSGGARMGPTVRSSRERGASLSNHTNTTKEIAPGIAASANTVRRSSAHQVSNTTATSGPITAPAWSIAR